MARCANAAKSILSTRLKNAARIRAHGAVLKSIPQPFRPVKAQFTKKQRARIVSGAF
jgi:hypothetical protein